MGSAGGCAPPLVTSACLLDAVLAVDPAPKGGYLYTYTGDGNVPSVGYQVSADPITPNQSGVRSFCSFADAVVRYTPSAALGGTCPVATLPLQ